jgi:GxxExxY protein
MVGEVGMHGDITGSIITCIIRVHQCLGPGFVEKIYRRALIVECARRGIRIETEKEVNIYYEGVHVGRHVLDLLVEGKVIVELKTVEALSKAHYKQVRSYLRATDLEIALLVNFADVRSDVRRIEARSVRPISTRASEAQEDRG